MPPRRLVQQRGRVGEVPNHPVGQGQAAGGAAMSRDTGRLGAGRYIDAAQAPETTVTSVHELTTADGATVSGVLRVVPAARTVVALMHPRQDLTHHVLVPELLARGYAVWTQGTRSVNNDLALVHEQALLDAAAGQVFLRENDFDRVVTRRNTCPDRKSTRLNSSHLGISYAVFCLKK